uniref:Uncharacterized protein n=1 Tax=Cacopsylla melanoneura TaxID=428564 RepID=A0A8D8YR74_9HEMI
MFTPDFFPNIFLPRNCFSNSSSPYSFNFLLHLPSSSFSQMPSHPAVSHSSLPSTLIFDIFFLLSLSSLRMFLSPFLSHIIVSVCPSLSLSISPLLPFLVIFFFFNIIISTACFFFLSFSFLFFLFFFFDSAYKGPRKSYFSLCFLFCK